MALTDILKNECSTSEILVHYRAAWHYHVSTYHAQEVYLTSTHSGPFETIVIK